MATEISLVQAEFFRPILKTLDSAGASTATLLCGASLHRFDLSPGITRMPMAALAQDLNLSVRTLRRRLAARQTTFRVVLENWRIANAKPLLRQPEPSIQSVAKCLGYTHV